MTKPIETVTWGGVKHPGEALYTHALIQGRTGSGKTSVLTALLEERLANLIARNGRMVLADPKRENGALCHAFLPLRVPVWNVNPLATDGVGWAIGEDLREPVEADHASEVFVPEKKGDANDFFTTAARLCLRGLILSLQVFGKTRWTLADLVNLSRLDFLRAVLDLLPETRAFARKLLTVEKTTLGVIATLTNHLTQLETSAACYAAAGRQVSLRKFLDEPAVLLLGYDDAISTPLMALYPLMMKLLQCWVLARNDRTKPIDFVIDELTLFGKCDFTPIALKGRSAGASLTIAFQDINGLDALYGREKSRELLANLAMRCFLSTESKEGAQFASDSIGEHEVSQFTKTVTVTEGRRSEGTSEQIVRRPLVLPDEVRNLPFPTWSERLVHGYFRTPFAGSYKGAVPFRPAMERVNAVAQTLPRYAQRPAAEQRIKPLTEDDLFRRLGFPLTELFKEAVKAGL